MFVCVFNRFLVPFFSWLESPFYEVFSFLFFFFSYVGSNIHAQSHNVNFLAEAWDVLYCICCLELLSGFNHGKSRRGHLSLWNDLSRMFFKATVKNILGSVVFCFDCIFFLGDLYSFFSPKENKNTHKNKVNPSLENGCPLSTGFLNFTTKWLPSSPGFPPPRFFHSLPGCGRILTARREVQWRLSAPGAENKWQEGMRRDQGNLGWKLLNLIRVNLQRAIVCKSQDCWALPCARSGLRTRAADIDSIKTREMHRKVQNEHFCGFFNLIFKKRSQMKGTQRRCFRRNFRNKLFLHFQFNFYVSPFLLSLHPVFLSPFLFRSFVSSFLPPFLPLL